MAEAGSWPSIERHGLLSTTALLDLFEVNGELRFQIESSRRPRSITIEHPEHGTAVIRDNIPLLEKVLERTLVGMSPREWYEALNRKVFFWVAEERLERLRNAGAYARHKHLILTVDTEQLVVRHGERILLSPMNSGATHPGARYTRGVDTFKNFDEYPWEARAKANAREPVVELAVDYSVPDIAEYVIERETR